MNKGITMGGILDLVSPVAQRALDDIWDATIGSWIGLWADKKKFDREMEFADYKNKILTEWHKIPDDKKTDPKFAIVGPALEASKFYIDEEILRDMFAKLIANSMNLDKQQFARSAFVEIIKQMSPTDAKILKTFMIDSSQPLSRFIEYSGGDSQNVKKDQYQKLIDQVYTMPGEENKSVSDVLSNGISINNLSRLGLLEYVVTKITGERLANDELYQPHMRIMEEQIKPGHPHVDIIKGVVKVTQLGAAFIKSCME